MLTVDTHQAVEFFVDRFGVFQQLGIEQRTQLINVAIARQAAHAVLQLTVIAHQLLVALVHRPLLRATDVLFVLGLRCTDLLVAQVQQFHGFLLNVGLTVNQQAVRQHAQAQRQLGELIQVLDARHARGADVLGRRADLAHLEQCASPQNQHQCADQRKP